MSLESQSMTRKKTIGFTLGDLGGVGLEIYENFLKEKLSCQEDFNFVLVDQKLDYQSKLKKIEKAKASKLSGEHAYETLKLANKLCIEGELDYLITGPVAKESLWLAGIQVSGQTELLAKLNGLSREEIEMFFILDEFRIVLATRHIPIKDVSEVLEQRIEHVLKNSTKAMKEFFKIEKAKIALAGLNPHAGENGILGLEEKKFMIKAIEDFSRENKDIDLSGPYSADSLFAIAAQKYLNREKLDYDLYIAAYHDQALPLIKGIGALRAINLTYGLPYIRLSVDHGTGFNIVGKSIASYQGLESCFDFCSKELSRKSSALLDDS